MRRLATRAAAMIEAAQVAMVPPHPTRERLLTRLDLITCLSLGLGALAINVSLALVFADKQLVAYGALFQSDPDKWIETFVHGNGVPTFRHPLLMLVLHPLLVGLGGVIAAVSPAGWEPVAVRGTLVLLIVPVLSGLRAAALFALLRVLNLPHGPSVLLVLVSMISFSQLIYGSIPDHMAISGALLTFLFFQGALSITDTRFDKLWVWALLGLAAIGATVTNAVPFAIIYACVRFARGETLSTILARTGAITIALVAVAVLIAFTFAPLFEYTGRLPSYETTAKFFHLRPAEVIAHAERFPLMLSYTLAPAIPDTGHSRFYEQMGAPFATVFKYRVITIRLTEVAPFLRSLVAVIAVIGGLFFWLRTRNRVAVLAGGAALVLLFNWVFHSLWGTGWYCYSQHWHGALMVILGGWLTVDRRYQPIVVGGLAILLIACVVADVRVLSFIFANMDELSRASSHG